VAKIMIKYFSSKAHVPKKLALISINIILIAFIGEYLFPLGVLSEFHWKIVQRAFVGIVIGAAFFVFGQEFTRFTSGKYFSDSSSTEKERSTLTLSIISLCVLSQIYPLFSSHHSWYSLIPIILSCTLYLEDKGFLQQRLDFKWILFSALLIAVYLTIWQVSNITSSSRPPIRQIVFTENAETKSLSKILNFANSNIPRNSVIQNFCPDPTIFVVRPDLIPASRIFIWWNKFSQFNEYRSAAKQRADYELICRNPDYQPPTNLNLTNLELVYKSTKELSFDLYKSKKS